MKKNFVALAALAALGLTACGPTNASSDSTGTEPQSSTVPSTSSSTSEGDTYTAVTITNKDALTSEWFEYETAARRIELSITPAGNIMNLINTGVMTITSSNTAVVTVSGQMVTAVGAGTATVTVTISNPNGTSVTDSVTITISADPYKTGAPESVTPTSGTYARLGCLQGVYGYYMFADGGISNHYPTTVADFRNGANFLVTEKDGKWTLKISGGNYDGNYIGAELSGTYRNIVFGTTEYAWDYNAEGDYFYTNLGGTDYYVGTYNDYKTLSLSNCKYVSNSSTNFPARLFTWSAEATMPTITAPDMTPVETTIHDLKTGTVATNKIYQVTGIFEGRAASNDKYVNGWLTDPTTGETIEVYGMSKDMTAFSADGAAIVFDNPELGKTDLAGITNGLKLTLNVNKAIGHNNFYTALVKQETVTDKYAITLPTSVEHGSVTADVTEAAYGATVTLTVTPEEGYVVDKVTVADAYSESAKNATADKDDATKYTFTATCVNKVSVSFKEKPAESDDTIVKEYVIENYEPGEQYVANEVHELDEYTTLTTINDNCSFSSNLRLYGVGNQGKAEGGKVLLTTTNAVTKISLHAGNKVGVLLIEASADNSEFTEVESLNITAAYADYDVTVAVAGAKYIRISNATTSNAQIRINSFTLTMAK